MSLRAMILVGFGGIVLGVALGGVGLQYGLDNTLLMIDAYQTVFRFTAGVTLLGIIVGWGLRE